MKPQAKKLLAIACALLAFTLLLYFRNLIEGLLSAEGYGVQTTAHSPELPELIERDGPFDLVLLDWVTAVVDGLDGHR